MRYLEKIEAELFHMSLNRSKFMSPSGGPGGVLNYSGAQIRLPSNPSRVDKLIAECLREYSRVVNLIARMDMIKNTCFFANVQLTIQAWYESIVNVQERRRDEVIRSTNKARLAGTPVHQVAGARIYDEKGRLDLTLRYDKSIYTK